MSALKLETLRPLNEWVVVRLEKPKEEVSTGGLVLVRDEKKNPRLRAKVVAVGPGGWARTHLGYERVTPEVKPGDLVVLQRSNISQEDDSGLALLPQNEIVAVVEVES